VGRLLRRRPVAIGWAGLLLYRVLEEPELRASATQSLF
jgi:hypothetical protein